MSPKSLLRHPKCISTLEDLAAGSFQHIIVDDIAPKNIKNAVFCSGKVYYELLTHREMIDLFQSSSDTKEKEIAATYFKKFGSMGILNRLKNGETINTSTIAINRIEQLYPFPSDEIKECLQSFGNPKVTWCQEEPRNMGAWPMFDEWLCNLLDGEYPEYIGRKTSASPAAGSKKNHTAEQAAIIDKVFKL